MNDIQTIQNKIYEIRGQRVMLDFDLAEAYGVETAQLKRQVRRNIERFEGEDETDAPQTENVAKVAQHFSPLSLEKLK